MYKKLHINRKINKVLGDLGHTDKICICDVGLPIPDGVKCIDLSLRVGEPSFIDVLKSIVESMYIEDVIIANEFVANDDAVFEQFEQINIKWNTVSHKDFKEMCKDCKVIIRTGQATPYANVIVTSKPFF